MIAFQAMLPLFYTEKYCKASLLSWRMALWFLFSPGDPESVAGEYGRHSLYKMLGYFSLVGLLRLHSLLGDYYQAIKVLENIELNKKVIQNVVTLLLQPSKCLCSCMLVKNCCTESSS